MTRKPWTHQVLEKFLSTEGAGASAGGPGGKGGRAGGDGNGEAASTAVQETDGGGGGRDGDSGGDSDGDRNHRNDGSLGRVWD